MNKVFIVLFAAAVMVGCKKADHQHEQASTEATENHEGHNHAEHADERPIEEHAEAKLNTTSISLDDGKKWKVNPEMKPFIEGGEKILSEYISKNNTNFAELGTKLTKENEQLVKSCTMKGKSHEELHVWLVPHLKLVEELAQTKDLEKGKQMSAALERSYLTYHQFFE